MFIFLHYLSLYVKNRIAAIAYPEEDHAGR